MKVVQTENSSAFTQEILIFSYVKREWLLCSYYYYAHKKLHDFLLDLSNDPLLSPNSSTADVVLSYVFIYRRKFYFSLKKEILSL